MTTEDRKGAIPARITKTQVATKATKVIDVDRALGGIEQYLLEELDY
jgi:hypothetical protein